MRWSLTQILELTIRQVIQIEQLLHLWITNTRIPNQGANIETHLKLKNQPLDSPFNKTYQDIGFFGRHPF